MSLSKLIITNIKNSGWILIVLLVLSCARKNSTTQIYDTIHSVQPVMETVPVPRSDDAADDMCIWIHPTDPSLSTIIGTDKTEKGGLVVYDLKGNLIQYANDGRMNNVDLRYNFSLNGESVALVTAGNRSENTLSIYRVHSETRYLENVALRNLPLGVGEVYGSCMYRSPKTDFTYAFINDKTGKIEQWRLFDGGNGLVDGELVRTLSVGSQPEGCVADDVLAKLYVGAEEVGIWEFGAEPENSNEKIIVDSVGVHVVPDVEGLTIYYSNDSTGYLIASSQGNNTYVIYERGGNHKYIGTFQIVDGEHADGTSDTDGIDVSNFNLGPSFPDGIFVAQDGDNAGENQNFKCVSWKSLAFLFDPPLLVDVSWDPRNVGLSK